MTTSINEQRIDSDVLLTYGFLLSEPDPSRRRSIHQCLVALRDIELFMRATIWLGDIDNVSGGSIDPVERMSRTAGYSHAMARMAEVQRLSYASPYEFVATITLSMSSAIGVAAAFIKLRNSFWDSQLRTAIRKRQISFFEEADYAVIRDSHDLDPLLRNKHDETLAGIESLAGQLEAVELRVDGNKIT